MFNRIWMLVFDHHVAADAARLIRSHGPEAIKAAEFSAVAAMEDHHGHLRRVAREIARRARRQSL